MATSAPSDFTSAWFLVLAVVATCAPRCLASWMTTVPTPPEPAWIRTFGTARAVTAPSFPLSVVTTDGESISRQHRGAVRRRHGRVESKIPSDPGVHRARRRKSAKQSQTGREATGRVSEFRPSRPGGFQHNVGHDARLVGGLEGRAQPPAHGRTCLTVFIELRVGFQQVRVELRLRVRRLDDRDSDSPRAELMIE